MLDCFCCLLKPKNYDLLHLYCRCLKIICLFLRTEMTPTDAVGMINAHNAYRVSICPEDILDVRLLEFGAKLDLPCTAILKVV